MTLVTLLLWIFVAFFGIVGLTRAWQKEVIVSASLILAIYAIKILNKNGQLFNLVQDPLRTADALEIVIVKVSRWMIVSLPFLLIAISNYSGSIAHVLTKPKNIFGLLGTGLKHKRGNFLLGMLNGYMVISAIATFGVEQRLLTPYMFFVRYSVQNVISEGVLLIIMMVMFAILLILSNRILNSKSNYLPDIVLRSRLTDYESKLRKTLQTRFSISELEALCADLGLSLEDIEGTTRDSKALHLVLYFQRRNELALLEREIARQRPKTLSDLGISEVD